ncbi:MAG: hypothetical protein ACK55Z_14965, partial [bacterium]
MRRALVDHLRPTAEICGCSLSGIPTISICMPCGGPTALGLGKASLYRWGDYSASVGSRRVQRPYRLGSPVQIASCVQNREADPAVIALQQSWLTLG